MALTFDYSKCKRDECVDSDGNMTSTLESLIWATMILGIPEINDKTIKEFAFRLEFDRRLVGTFKTDGQFTVKFLTPFIGLRTNATKVTRAEFLKRISGTFETFNKEIFDA